MERRGVRGLAGLMLGVAVAAGVFGSADARLPPPDPATCELEDHVLRIDPGHYDITVRRSGEEIQVRKFRGRVQCDGGPVTVQTVDRIRLVDDEVALDLRGGEFAPGTTDEGDGSSEIEVRVPAFAGGLLVRLPTVPQHVRAGELPDGESGINLNASESTPDVDVLIRPRGRFSRSFELEMYGTNHADILTGRGGPEFEGTFGHDLFLGGREGNDLLRGGDGKDVLLGGDGRDEVYGGRKADLVLIKDRRRDFADCGAGEDLAHADAADRTRNCGRFPAS